MTDKAVHSTCEKNLFVVIKMSSENTLISMNTEPSEPSEPSEHRVRAAKDNETMCFSHSTNDEPVLRIPENTQVCEAAHTETLAQVGRVSSWTNVNRPPVEWGSCPSTTMSSAPTV